jgi:hypothetical protein
MMNYGKMVIVGNTIEELEQDLEMLKVALKSGKKCAVGGSSVAEVENGLAMMKEMMGATPSKPHKCNCDCGGVCEECEDPEDLPEDFWDDEEDLDEEEDLEEEELGEEFALQSLGGQMVRAMIEAYEEYHRK